MVRATLAIPLAIWIRSRTPAVCALFGEVRAFPVLEGIVDESLSKGQRADCPNSNAAPPFEDRAGGHVRMPAGLRRFFLSPSKELRDCSSSREIAVAADTEPRLFQVGDPVGMQWQRADRARSILADFPGAILL